MQGSVYPSGVYSLQNTVYIIGRLNQQPHSLSPFKGNIATAKITTVCVHRCGYCTETTKKKHNMYILKYNTHPWLLWSSITLETLNVAEVKELRIYNICPVSQLYRYRLADINQCVPTTISCRYPYTTVLCGCSKKLHVYCGQPGWRFKVHNVCSVTP